MEFAKVKSKQVTGYKVVKKVGGHLYSFATGMEYKRGLIKPPTQYGKHRDKLWGDICCFLGGGAEYYPQYKGYTGIFLKLKEAEEFLTKIKKPNYPRNDFIIVKMTLAKVDLISRISTDGCDLPIVLGKEIVSIKTKF
jgi:hypothetical protein